MPSTLTSTLTIVPSSHAQTDPCLRERVTEEARLIHQAQNGDVDAFKALYKQHVNRVYSLCLRLCADRGLAEDACQEVFVQLWQKIQNFDGRSKFSTWLHSVASNTTISYLRKQKGWLQKVFNIETTVVMDSEADSEADLEQLEKMIYRLPERARWVFVLHAIEGYRHDEIANMLDMAVGTSKAQFFRAKSLIEEWMSES